MGVNQTNSEKVWHGGDGMKAKDRGGPLRLPGDFGDALSDLLKVKPLPKVTTAPKRGKRKQRKKR